MTAVNQEKLVVRKQIPMITVTTSPLEDKYFFEELKEGHIKKDPFQLPPIRDVYEPLIRRETVRFNPFDGEVFVLGQKKEQNQITIDRLDPQKESFWINFSRLDDAYSASKRFYLDQGKSAIVNNTEEIIFSTIDNFPQFFESDINEQAVRSIVNNICINLIAKGQIIDGDNQEYIKHALHNHRGIRNGHYSEQEKKSRLGSVVLDVINDLIEKRGVIKYYSPTLANLLVEQQIEQQFMLGFQKDFTRSIVKQLHPHYYDLQQIEKSLLQTLKKYFSFPIFRCTPIKQSAEGIQKAILKINRIIQEFGDYNPNKAMDLINELMIKTA